METLKDITAGVVIGLTLAILFWAVVLSIMILVYVNA